MVDRSPTSLCVSASRNEPEWAKEGLGAVNRSEGALLCVPPCVVQVLKAYNQLLHTCDTIQAVNCSTASLCLEMLPSELKRASERSTALEMHSCVSHQVLFKFSRLETACWMPEIQYEWSTARHCLCASLCLEMPPNGLKAPPERSTASEVHPRVS